MLKYNLHVERKCFKSVDLTENFSENFDKRYDLAFCLEVAEHLQENKADNFVSNRCKLSDLILFSTAIPGQTGENHYNEQYPDYWSELFKKRNYFLIDYFRKKFWNDANVDWWYKQNMFLVVHESRLEDFKDDLWDGSVMVSPELFNMYVSFLKSENKTFLDGDEVVKQYNLRKFLQIWVKKRMHYFK